MILGIAGTLGSGKGTVVKYLKEKGFVHYSVSGRLAEMVKEDGLPAVREHLSAQADKLAASYEGGILEVMHLQAKADGVSDYILESIHRESEAAYIRSIGGTILTVDADPKVRYERTHRRQESEKDNVTYEQFLEAIDREEKGEGNGLPNINAVIRGSEHTIMNDGTVEELHQKIEEWLQSQNK